MTHMTTESSHGQMTPRAARQARLPLYVTWAATTVAIALGLVPLFIGPSLYDPMVALTVAGSVGLAWYTYFTRQGVVEARSREERFRDERRRSLATAVLAELGSLVGRLNSVLVYGSAAAFSRDFISAPVLGQACECPELFTARTVQALLGLRLRLQDAQILLDEVHELEQDGARQEPMEQKHTLALRADKWETLKVLSRRAYNASCQLVADLEREGGEMPGPIELAATGPDEVKLLPNPFRREVAV